MIIDCHGHYTTAPKQLQDFRDAQIAELKTNSGPNRSKAAVTISDDQIRESLEGAQLKFQRERGTDVTIFSPRASAMGHHIGDATTSLHCTLMCGAINAAQIRSQGPVPLRQTLALVHGGRVLALNPATGEERWVWRGPGPGYASPIVITAGGVRQIITLTNSSIVGIDARTGAELWTAAFPDEWHENIVTPIWTGKHLIVSGVTGELASPRSFREANDYFSSGPFSGSR